MPTAYKGWRLNRMHLDGLGRCQVFFFVSLMVQLFCPFFEPRQNMAKPGSVFQKQLSIGKGLLMCVLGG